MPLPDDNKPRVEVRSRAELRAWLAAHHARESGAWLISWKKATPHYLDYGELVRELLCWGWIDSTARGVDAARSAVWISPRRPGSPWSAVNKRNLARIAEEGSMMPPGAAQVAAAKADGSWTLLDDIEQLIEPEDLRAALDAAPTARAHYNAFPPSTKKAILWWIKQAKRAATRQQRITTTVDKAGRNERAR